MEYTTQVLEEHWQILTRINYSNFYKKIYKMLAGVVLILLTNITVPNITIFFKKIKKIIRYACDKYREAVSIDLI